MNDQHHPQLDADLIAAELKARIIKLETRINRLEILLDECHEFLEQYSDTKDGPDNIPQPNWAMSLITQIDEAVK